MASAQLLSRAASLTVSRLVTLANTTPQGLREAAPKVAVLGVAGSNRSTQVGRPRGRLSYAP
jgi:hypothetical protein